MFGIGRIEELVVILVIFLMLFGSKKLPELSKGIAESVRELRKGFTDDLKTDAKAEKAEPAK